MALLASVNYDPATAVSAATSALLAMTALDTTNLRLTFTTPSNGFVLVRMRCVVVGATWCATGTTGGKGWAIRLTAPAIVNYKAFFEIEE